jgi:hypothetical protein
MSVWSAIGNYIVGIFKGITGQLGETTATFLEAFAKTDLGNLAIDAVTYVEGALEGSAGTVKRDAAVAKLKTDAAAAGHDLSTFAASTLNFLIETALQVVVAKGI